MTFTPTAPTEAGFYAWRKDARCRIWLVVVQNDAGQVMCQSGSFLVNCREGEWCRLVSSDWCEIAQELADALEKERGGYVNAGRELLSKFYDIKKGVAQ